MCCTRLGENTGCKKSPSGHHHTTLSGWIFATKARINNRKKKLVKQQYLLHMSPQYGELRPTSSWDRLAGLGHPSKFQRLLRLGFVTAARSLNGSQPNFARCLALTWAGRLFIHFRRLLPRNGLLPGAKFSLRPPKSCTLLYWQRYCTALQQCSRREPNFAVLSTRCHLYSAGRPSRWALAHILVVHSFTLLFCCSAW